MNKISILIMFISSFILGYFLNETISLTRNITNNKHKMYMALFMAFQMALIEFLMIFYFMDYFNIYLLGALLIGVIYTGYKLRTLNFLDDKQLLLAMIEHHQNAIEMVDANDKYYRTKPSAPRFNELKYNIKTTQEKEIAQMYHMLRYY